MTPALQRAPFLGGDHARDQVERQDAVDRGRVGIDGEGDAALQQVAFGIGGAAAQRLDRQMAQPVAQQRQRRMRRLAGPQHLAEQAARIVAPPEHRPAASVALDRIALSAYLARFVPRCHGIATSRSPGRCPIRGPAAARSLGSRISGGRSAPARRRSPPPRRRAARSRQSRSCRSSSRRARRRPASRYCWR